MRKTSERTATTATATAATCCWRPPQATATGNNDKRLTSRAADLDTSTNRHIKRPSVGRERDWQTDRWTNGQGTECEEGKGGKLGVRLTHWRDSRVCRLPLCVTISKLHIYAHMALRHAPRLPPPWLTDNINQSYTRVCVSLCVSVCVCVCWRVLIGKLWQQPWEQQQNRRYDWQQALQLAAIMQAGGREGLLWEGKGVSIRYGTSFIISGAHVA